MKISELAELISSKCEELDEEAEILVEDEEGQLWEFDVQPTEAQFDGFDTYCPEGLKIVIRKD